MRHSLRPLILMVDDCIHDCLLLREALQEMDRGTDFKSFAAGPELLAYLDLRDAVLPALILLDINLPAMSGFEILDALRAEPRFRSIPVVMWTTSSNPDDVQAAYYRGANSYACKPDEYSRLRDSVKLLTQYWNHFVANPAF